MAAITRIATKALDSLGGPKIILAAIPGGIGTLAREGGVSPGRVSQILRQNPLRTEWAQLIAHLIGCSEWEVYEQLGLCAPGGAESLVHDRITWLGSKLPVNPSGGLTARGHPTGATGAAQVVELAWQLDGRCGERQVPGARVALAQNGGGWVGTDAAACAVHVLVT